MANGFWDRILRVDLSTGRVWEEHPGEAFFRKHAGGRSFIAHYLLQEVPASVDALDPENRLMFMAGEPSTSTEMREENYAERRSTISRQVRAAGVASEASAAPQTRAPDPRADDQTGSTMRCRLMPETSTSKSAGTLSAAGISRQSPP